MSFAELACATVSVFCLLYGVLARGWLRIGLLGVAAVFALVALGMGFLRWWRSRDG